MQPRSIVALRRIYYCEETSNVLEWLAEMDARVSGFVGEGDPDNPCGLISKILLEAAAKIRKIEGE